MPKFFTRYLPVVNITEDMSNRIREIVQDREITVADVVREALQLYLAQVAGIRTIVIGAGSSNPVTPVKIEEEEI